MQFRRTIVGRAVLVACAAAALGAAPGAPEPAVSPEAAEFFETRVRPVLAESCISCHGPKVQMAGLRLDSREGALKGGRSGPAIVSGDPEKSPLVHAIRYGGKVKMPPTGKLPAPAIEALEAWVKRGAPWPTHAGASGADLAAAGKTHWAFAPVRMPAVPRVKDPSWVKTPIDAFVLARLETEGMKPSPPADRRTLIRRATFDLTGLPPTAAEVAAFLADSSRDDAEAARLRATTAGADRGVTSPAILAKKPDAYEKLIDRLLASPRYGERWGRYWLDVARYADSKGYVFQEERRYPYAYTYRDYVIRAFNEDLPYDQFILQQLAADLPTNDAGVGTPVATTAGVARSRLSSDEGGEKQDDDRRSLAAMGFLTLGRRFLNNQADIIDDRIDVVTRGFLGLTVACARCHDHKFDPIPTSDYYSLYGVFASSREPRDLPLLAPPARTAEYLAYEKELNERQERVEQFVATKREEVLATLKGQVADYLLAAREAKGTGEADRRFARDRDLNGLMLRRWMNFMGETEKGYHPVFGPWHAFAAIPDNEFAAKAKDVAAKLAANDDPSAHCLPAVARAFAGEPPATLRQVAERYQALLAEAERQWRALLAEHEKKGEPAPGELPDADQEALRQVLTAIDGPFSVPADETERLFDRAIRNELQALRQKVEEWKATSPAAPPRAMALEDLPEPVTPRIFVRGNPNNPGPEVPRQFLQILAGEQRQPFRHGSGRLELARAIASPNNPLTARVMVNRVWLHHFGAGLVRTPSDFGLRGEPPTHPELLDYLAARFVKDGWSIKKLHRLIMLSAVYRQSSSLQMSPKRSRPERRGPSSLGDVPLRTTSVKDPENRLLWRMNRRRLDFEAMRDSLLFASGKLDLTPGGPAVEITEAPFPGRRTIYGFIDRQNLPGLFRSFDFASPDTHSPMRYQTTVPQQALFLMNGPFVVEQARALLGLPEVAGKQGEERIHQLYRRVLSRRATPEEVQLGLRFLQSAVTEAPEPLAPPPAWRYGYGEYDVEARRLKSFQPLPHFAGQAWQVGKEFPDASKGFLRLTATGGHPGNDRQHAAIRRWVAPRDGIVAISGTLRNPSKEGDGVQAFIVGSRTGELGRWSVHESQAETTVERVAVKKGDTIDFIVDPRENPNSDSFTWAPVVRLLSDPRATANDNRLAPGAARQAGAATPGAGAPTEWNANTEFGGPAPEPPKPLNAWEKYAQVLLMTNEFLFVD
jgi:mono/diheme cytochrome c family protein